MTGYKAGASSPEHQSIFFGSRTRVFPVERSRQGARNRCLRKGMKPELTMADVKNSVSDGSVILTQMPATSELRKRNKKYVIIGGCVIVGTTIVLAAILVGMHLFTEGQKNLLKYSLNMDKDTKEDVTVDENDNSIEYHSKTDDYELWVVDDFNKDIQTMKVKTGSGTNCYIGPLNRTALADPATIKSLPNLPSDANQNYTRRLSFDISGTPVTDTSFLGKKARDACKGTSVYWLHPKCDDKSEVQRSRRCSYYIVWFSYYCLGGTYICTDYYLVRSC